MKLQSVQNSAADYQHTDIRPHGNYQHTVIRPHGNYQHTVIRPHHTYVLRSALATGPSTNCIQNRHAGLHVSPWSDAFISEWVYSTSFNLSRPLATVVWHHQNSSSPKNKDVPRIKTSIGSRSFMVASPVTWFTCWAENTRTACSDFHQSLQQLLTAAHLLLSRFKFALCINVRIIIIKCLSIFTIWYYYVWFPWPTLSSVRLPLVSIIHCFQYLPFPFIFIYPLFPLLTVSSTISGFSAKPNDIISWPWTFFNRTSDT